MNRPGLFRPKALSHIASADQFDRLVRVTSPRHWIGLGAVLTVIAAVVVWSCVSTVPTTVSGSGYLLPEGGLKAIESPIAGTVVRFDLTGGEHVVDGQEVGEVRDADGQRVPIRAAGTGIVSEAQALRAEYVDAGERLALVQPIGWPAVVYAYLPTQVASSVVPGVPARVRFGAGISTAYGYAVGEVADVGRFPTTPERLDFVLQGAAVVARPQGGEPTSEVMIVLEQSASTPSGLVWGSGDGPPAVPVGLPAKVELMVGSRHPIDDVL
jgi:multidrug efflux pump subunit AcrA (membrane-fusion protein)